MRFTSDCHCSAAGLTHHCQHHQRNVTRHHHRCTFWRRFRGRAQMACATELLCCHDQECSSCSSSVAQQVHLCPPQSHTLRNSGTLRELATRLRGSRAADAAPTPPVNLKRLTRPVSLACTRALIFHISVHQRLGSFKGCSGVPFSVLSR